MARKPAPKHARNHHQSSVVLFLLGRKTRPVQPIDFYRGHAGLLVNLNALFLGLSDETRLTTDHWSP